MGIETGKVKNAHILTLGLLHQFDHPVNLVEGVVKMGRKPNEHFAGPVSPEGRDYPGIAQCAVNGPDIAAGMGEGDDGRTSGAGSLGALIPVLAVEAVPEGAEVDGDGEQRPVEQIESRRGRYKRERENIGAVNLRAEAEAEDMELQLQTMLEERQDLEAAIARLRQGISSLNREGRERLKTAFEDVNRHFADLFTGLFGGGKAYLEFTESDDPLEAGLEIMASPPGKRLQIMSLLSGGGRGWLTGGRGAAQEAGGWGRRGLSGGRSSWAMRSQ